VFVDDRASDLDVVVALLNTYDAYDAAPERLTSVESLKGLFGRLGWTDVATSRLAQRDVVAVKKLREQVRAIFAEAADGDAAAAAVLCNALLARVRPVLALQVGGDARSALGVADSGADAVRRLEERVSVSVAVGLASPGIRLGLCDAHPCRCAYVDRSRAGSRRFCCELCADRFAAAAYRRRKGAVSRGAR
jgi:predicted RNA-binding Zn ribbon-like protein